MSKELEALRVLKANAILFDDGTDFGASMLEAICDIEKALTPPTADEVCEELVEQTKTITEVEYSEKLNDFVIFQDIYGEWLGKLSFKEIREILPPHLITLIGRFYEGEIK